MDKFEKIRKIGEGSFGKALLVKKKDSGEMMVVKEINISKVGLLICRLFHLQLSIPHASIALPIRWPRKKETNRAKKWLFSLK
jgi:serine/threonine protein kinase